MINWHYCNILKRKKHSEKCQSQCDECRAEQVRMSKNKMKCPLCHTLNAEFIGKCICGNYIEAIDENTWKEEKWLEMHRKWEDGELGYNMIYSRLKELGYE